MNAIPTHFKGINFRSRLEARWAAFFDNVCWRWEYEPVDRQGWIPDFVVWPGGGSPLLVDIKPALDRAAMRARVSEVHRLAEERVLVLGAYLPGDEDEIMQPGLADAFGFTLGLFTVDPYGRRDPWCASVVRCPHGHLTLYLSAGDRPNLCGCPAPHDFHQPSDWFKECHDTNHVLTETRWAWREAGNLVQWVARDARRRRDETEHRPSL